MCRAIHSTSATEKSSAGSGSTVRGRGCSAFHHHRVAVDRYPVWRVVSRMGRSVSSSRTPSRWLGRWRRTARPGPVPLPRKTSPSSSATTARCRWRAGASRSPSAGTKPPAPFTMRRASVCDRANSIASTPAAHCRTRLEEPHRGRAPSRPSGRRRLHQRRSRRRAPHLAAHGRLPPASDLPETRHPIQGEARSPRARAGCEPPMTAGAPTHLVAHLDAVEVDRLPVLLRRLLRADSGAGAPHDLVEVHVVVTNRGS